MGMICIEDIGGNHSDRFSLPFNFYFAHLLTDTTINHDLSTQYIHISNIDHPLGFKWSIDSNILVRQQ